jgi:hypothetical protein
VEIIRKPNLIRTSILVSITGETIRQCHCRLVIIVRFIRIKQDVKILNLFTTLCGMSTSDLAVDGSLEILTTKGSEQAIQIATVSLMKLILLFFNNDSVLGPHPIL